MIEIEDLIYELQQIAKEKPGIEVCVEISFGESVRLNKVKVKEEDKTEFVCLSPSF